jgi:Tol biopolymer transport system component
MRKRRFSILLLVVSATLLSAVSGPDDRTATDPKTVTSVSNPDARPVPVEDLFYSRSVFGPAWSPDGKELVFTTNLTGRYNLWKVSTDGGFPIQLTASDDRQGSAAWSPDGKWIVYSQDRGGNEAYDLYAVPADGGEVVNLTQTPDIREDNPLFSPDGSRLGFFLKPKAASAVDLAILDWRTRAVRNLTNEKTKDHLWSSFVWSRDGKYLFGMRANAASTDSDLYRIDAQTGAAELLTPHSGEVLYDLNISSPDDRTLLIWSNQKGGFPNLALLDLASKKLTWITDTQWEAQVADFSPDGKSIAYVINADGRNLLYLTGLDGRGPKLEFPEGLTTITGKPSAFSPDGSRLLLSHQDSQRPSDLWIYDLKTRNLRQLTFSAIASLSPRSLPPSQLVHYKSFDGKMISAFLWMPQPEA